MKLIVYPKVNLCLKVFKQKIETKHKVDSVMALYKKMHDTIYIYKAHDLYILYKDHRKEFCLSDCIVSRVLHYLNIKYGIDINYNIKIVKNIPFGGGLGGGSADAAAVINFVLSQNPPIQLDLKEIALELGSDIPFFLSRYDIARVREHGQFVSPIYNFKPKFDLHINGHVCSTSKVFEKLDADENYTSRVNVDAFIENHLLGQPNYNIVYNDLTKYILEAYPELQPEYRKYTKNCYFTGSGSVIVENKNK